MIISRLTAVATTFAVVATASLAFAGAPRDTAAVTAAASEAIHAQPVRVVQLETVVVTAKRTSAAI